MSQPSTPTASGSGAGAGIPPSSGMGGGAVPVAPSVQILLDAEKEANRQVQQARQCTRPSHATLVASQQ